MSQVSPSRNGTPLPTSARLSLGNDRRFISTVEHLRFQLDHARARDAVHDLADFAALAAALMALGIQAIQLDSAIPLGPSAREAYLRRPDLGRRLSLGSAAKLREHALAQAETPQIAIVIADGLSALAIDRHALPLVEALAPHFAGLRQAAIALVRNARVAIGDEIGAILEADLAILLIGERPGLTAPDSLGVYLTWNPRAGRTDADRNCVSNIRAEGLGYEDAAQRIASYAKAARALGSSGFTLKEPGSPILPPVR